MLIKHARLKSQTIYVVYLYNFNTYEIKIYDVNLIIIIMTFIVQLLQTASLD